MSQESNEIDNETFPQIASFKNNNHRLIDRGTYFYNASLKGGTERYRHGKTAHTIHVWWARRPFSAMKPLVFASVCRSSDKNAVDMMKQLSSLDETANVDEFIAEDTKVLDMFGGGGTIPISAYELGIQSYSMDINPLSVFIQKNLIELFPKSELSKDMLIELLETTGRKILTELKEITSDDYERDDDVIVYITTYRYHCKNCSYLFFLSKRPWLDKKSDPYIGLRIMDSDTEQTFELIEVPKSEAKKYTRLYRSKSPLKTLECPKCRYKFNADIRDCDDIVVAHIKGMKKEIVLNKKEQYSPNIDDMLEKLSITSSEFSKIPKWSGIVNPALYGVVTYFDFLNNRQKLIILHLIDLLRSEYSILSNNYSEYTSNFIVSTLSALIDQLVDWNSRITMWISENRQPGRAFSGPGVAMYWDYCEIDPLLRGPANLWKKLDRIIKGVGSLDKMNNPGKVILGDARELPFEDETFDAIVTDPPYYDNIYYSILADFFHSWKYHVFSELSLFDNNTNHQQELVASSYRSKDPHGFYVDGMSRTLTETERVLTNEGVVSFIYSHSTLNGWAAICEAISRTELIVSSVQPLMIERKARPRGHNSVSIDACLVFVMHKKNILDIEYHTFEDVSNELRILGAVIHKLLRKIDWDDETIGLTIFANAVGMLANIKLTDRDTIHSNLIECESIVKQLIPNFRLLKRESI